MTDLRQIISIGGGGFGRNANHRVIEKYILDQSNAEIPNILFIPTASAEDKSYIVNYYTCFNALNCDPTHLNLFERTPRLESVINKADIIYVGGGNTKSMLAVWKEWKLDKLLLKAYNKGTIMAGVSAGAICWFEQGITDSWASNLNVLDCLGFVKGMCCPHYDSEEDRRPGVHQFLKDGKSKAGYALEDGSAIHLKNEKFYKGLSFFPNADAFYVSLGKNGIDENPLKMDFIQKI